MKHFENRKEQIWFQILSLQYENAGWDQSVIIKKDIFSGSGIDNAVLYNLFHITQKSI